MSIVFIGADHRGFKLKEEIKEKLKEWGYIVRDMGNKNYDTDDDYSEIAIKLAEKVAFEGAKGILICGSGVGVSIAANKVDGIRAGLCLKERQVRQAGEDDNINVLCLSADLVDEETNIELVKIFLETLFSGEERHIRRINKIKDYEKA